MELNFVVAITGILLSLSAPSYTIYQRRAESAEALVTLETIAHLEQVHILETGRAMALEALPAQVPRATRVHIEATQAWRDLGVEFPTKARFQYSVETSGPRDFIVRARGDLDGDGILSLYTIDSKTMEPSIQNAGE